MPRPTSWTSVLLVFVLVCCRGAEAESPRRPNQLTPQEVREGWILLFDGQTLFGWRKMSRANWRVERGAICVDSGSPGLLRTGSQFSDYHLALEFRAEPGTNSGVFVHTSPRPRNPKTDCYEVNIADPDTSPFPTGSLVGRVRGREPPRLDGKWHAMDVVVQNGRVEVRVDGVLITRYEDPRPLGRGYVGLQFNRGAVAFRSVRLKPLGLRPLLDRELSRWRVYPDKPARFQVDSHGVLQVRGGPGQLETRDVFGDFVLRLDVRVNGRGLNSGVFFRCIPGQFWQGYESQIHNGFRGQDRTQPVDCGTGGFYRRQNARCVVANDLEWFTKVLVVTGNHMATWVNGYQVSDWTDRRKPHPNPRRGCRREPGSIALQAHDPSTDLSFRNIQIAELRPRGK